MTCRFKSRARLEAENVVLRQQLNVLIRKLPKRLWLTKFGPAAVSLDVPALSFPPYCYPNCQARHRDPLAPSRLSSVLAPEISPRRGPATNPPRNSRPDPTDEHGQPTMGRCVQRRLARSVGDRPTKAKSQQPCSLDGREEGKQ